MRTRSVILGLALLWLGAAAPSAAQVTGVSLIHAGRDIPLPADRETIEAATLLSRALLATAHTDVTRHVDDAELTSLGQRGTLLKVRLGRPEDVFLVRLAARARASRVAAYVPPERDDRAFVFLGRAQWERIVVVDLPETVRSRLREVRRSSTAGS